MAEQQIMKLKLTLDEARILLRENGFPINKDNLADRIASGLYPFGRVVSVAPSGKRTFEIFRRDVEKWLSEKGAIIYES